jgi:hypothetical protein
MKANHISHEMLELGRALPYPDMGINGTGGGGIPYMAHLSKNERWQHAYAGMCFEIPEVRSGDRDMVSRPQVRRHHAYDKMIAAMERHMVHTTAIGYWAQFKPGEAKMPPNDAYPYWVESPNNSDVFVEGKIFADNWL